MTSSHDVTRILAEMQGGDAAATDRLMGCVYLELRQLARKKMAGEQPGQTIQPTALVHEAWLRLVDADGKGRFENRAHFFSAAAEAMRRILIEVARRKLAIRHGGGQERIDADEIEIAAPTANAGELLAVHDALDALAAHDARKAELVKLRYFAGFSLDEAAEILGISAPTAKRDWAYARAWLFRELQRAHSIL